MKPSTVKKSIQATKRVAKTAALKKPRIYKNVGSSPISTRSPIISISKKDKDKLIDISHDIVKLVNIYHALGHVSVLKYSFSVLDISKTDFLEFTRDNTKLIKEVIKKIFVEVEKSKFIYIDTLSYIEIFIEYDVLIDNFIDRITHMTTNDFIEGAVGFFDDLPKLLLKFFDYIKTNIKIKGDIYDKEIINVVNNEILRCAKEGYVWFSNTGSISNAAININKFMRTEGELINKQEQHRRLKEEKRHEAIRGLMACKANKSCR